MTQEVSLKTEMTQLRSQGFKLYEKIQRNIELKDKAKFICINLQTGEYIIEASRAKVYERFEEMFGDVYSWEVRIGDPLTSANRIFGPIRAKRNRRI